MIDLEQATARDPLRPTLLHLLRATMTPDTPAQVDLEEDALGQHLDALAPEDFARLQFLAMSVLNLASPAQLGVLNVTARNLGLDVRVVQRRGNG